MNSSFLYSDSNKRYHTYSYFLKKKFGQKVVKIPLNAGLSCPNRDGLKGVGGCTYCSELLSGDFGGNPQEPISQQFENVKKLYEKKWPNALYIPYFQSGTNTYSDVKTLSSLYNEALALDNVVGLSISTRPDCIDEEISDLLAEISKKTYLTVELGLQSVHDSTGKLINRCHSYQDFLDGYNLLNDRGINICVHIINGLPSESFEMMIETARTISLLNIHSIKIHLLHIINGTQMHEQFLDGSVSSMSLEEYVDTVCSQLEVISPDVIVQRLTGDGNKSTLVSPLWSTDKLNVMNSIDKEFVRRGSCQGFYFNKK